MPAANYVEVENQRLAREICRLPFGRLRQASGYRPYPFTISFSEAYSLTPHLLLVLICALADGAPIHDQTHRLSEILTNLLGLSKPVRLRSGPNFRWFVFYFCSVEEDELVVFVIVMSPPPLASFFGLRSPGLMCFLICFFDFFISVFFTWLSYGVLALLPQGSGGF